MEDCVRHCDDCEHGTEIEPHGIYRQWRCTKEKMDNDENRGISVSVTDIDEEHAVMTQWLSTWLERWNEAKKEGKPKVDYELPDGRVLKNVSFVSGIVDEETNELTIKFNYDQHEV
jgi:hypothetical protein